jgi:hypothetical protein
LSLLLVHVFIYLPAYSVRFLTLERGHRSSSPDEVDFFFN